MNGTIARLTRASLLRGWRGVLLALLPLALLLVSTAMRVSLGDKAEDTLSALLGGLNAATVVPLIALIIGTGAISTEVDDGSIVYLLTKPIPRWKIIVTKYTVAVVTAVVFAAVPTFIAGVIITGGIGTGVVAFAVGAGISCVVYCALFILIGVLSKQAVIIGLMYVLLWENLVCGLVSGARVMSIQYWASAVAAKIDPEVVEADVNLVVAIVGSVVVTVGAVWYAGRRLRSLTLASEG
jgi:ABC-2 type transport system permease protein